MYRQILRSKGDARAAFESTYGVDFAVAEAQYLDESPYGYGALIGCDAPEVPNSGVLEWEEVQ